MIGAVIVIMLSLVFSDTPYLVAIIPLAVFIGGLVGNIMSKRKNQQKG